MLGDVIIQCAHGEERLKPLSVRQLVTMQNLLGSRRAQEAMIDGRAAGMSGEELMLRAARIREDASLTSWIIRWAFTLEGASEIVKESCGGDFERLERIAAGCSPDELSEAALKLIGFEWDPTTSKWVSRSHAARSRATGSSSAS